MKYTCNDCRHFSEVDPTEKSRDKSGSGLCKRFPPLPVILTGGEGSRSIFPIVAFSDEECGEFEAKPMYGRLRDRS